MSDHPVRVWFNNGFSSLYNVINLIRAAAEESASRPYFILCTHHNPEFVGFESADFCALEPKGLDSAAYVDWCLSFCREQSVRVFFPNRNAHEIAARRHQFEAIGVTVMQSATETVMNHFENKGQFYAEMPSEIAITPAFRIVRSAASFSEALADLAAEGHALCMKPARSIGGMGFHIFDHQQDDLAALLHSRVIRVSPDHVAAILAHTEARGASIPPILVMEFLSGTEYSVDCLARRGQLVQAIIRRKPGRAGRAQRIVENPEITAMCARLSAHFNLDGIFNAQFRKSHGQPKIIEINARMAGGIYVSALSGLVIPHWAIQLALGLATPAAVPTHRTGLKVQRREQEILLQNPVALAFHPSDDLPPSDSEPLA